MRNLITAPYTGGQCPTEFLSRLLRLKSDRGIFHPATFRLAVVAPTKMLIALEGAQA